MDYTNLILLSFGFSIGLFGFSFYKGRKLQKEINQLEDLIDELDRINKVQSDLEDFVKMYRNQ
jgi:hypothetical protein